MKVLWLQTGTTNCEPIIGSLEAQEHPDYELWSHNYFQGPDILGAVKEIKPDLVLYISVVAGPSLPKIEDLKAISEITKLVHICCDAGCSDWWPLITQYMLENVFHLTVNLDGNENWPQNTNHMTMLCPIDPRPYDKDIPWEDRIYPVGFAGGNGSPERRDILGRLGELVKIKPREEGYGSYQNFAEFLLQTKICLNMASTGPNDSKQVKARVIEAGHAGCCLLEQEGSPISKYFKEGRDYYTYRDENDVVKKVTHLLENTELQKELARNLKKEVKMKYSGHNFWKTVFEYVQLPWI